jgi:hypothetical protein
VACFYAAMLKPDHTRIKQQKARFKVLAIIPHQGQSARMLPSHARDVGLPHRGVKKACQSLLFKSQDVSRSCERGLISR